MHVVKMSVETDGASKYLKQLAKHFAHKVAVDVEGDSAAVAFPYGDCVMTAEAGVLSFRCETEEADNVPLLKDVIDSHLLRFAWREELTLVWGEEA